MQDIQGKAIVDYWNGEKSAQLKVHTSYGELEKMPVKVFFRSETQLPALEKYALSLCQGKTLDVGAGAGSHSLILQKRGIDVTPLDISPLCVEVMQSRGIKHVICDDIFALETHRFDTILILMNGLGLAKNLEGIPGFLYKMQQLIQPDGQLLIDSCDVSYLAEEGSQKDGYMGEIFYQFEYKGEKGPIFPWLYADIQTFQQIVQPLGWHFQVIYEEPTGQYLARLIRDERA